MAISTILWLSGDSKFSCFSNVSFVVDLSRVTKWRARSLIFSSLAQPLSPQWCHDSGQQLKCGAMKARYISILNSKGNIFFKRLRTATCWLTVRQILRIYPSNLSLLSIVTPKSSISSSIGITVPSQVNTGFLSTLSKVIAWYFEWFLLCPSPLLPIYNVIQFKCCNFYFTRLFPL